jgi:hypothetical protein
MTIATIRDELEELLPDRTWLEPTEAFLHKASGLTLPSWIGSFHLESVMDYGSRQAGAGIGLDYAAPQAKASLYLYDAGLSDIADGINSERALQAFRGAIHDVQEAAADGRYRDLRMTEPILTDRLPGTGNLPFATIRFRYLESDGDCELQSLLWLTGIRGHFFKVRLTLSLDLFEAHAGRELVDEFATQMAVFLAEAREEECPAGAREVLASMAEPLASLAEGIRQVANVDLPISGGWGYTLTGAVRIRRPAPTLVGKGGAMLRAVEESVVEQRSLLELVAARDESDRLYGLRCNERGDDWVECEGRHFHRRLVDISGLREADFAELKAEFESGKNDPTFDFHAHATKRDERLVHVERAFWFDVTELLSAASH